MDEKHISLGYEREVRLKLLGGNRAVICTCYMTRRSALHLDEQHISNRNLT